MILQKHKVLFPTKDKGSFREIFENFTSPNGKNLIKKLGESYSNDQKISDLCKKLCGEKTSKGKMITIVDSEDLFYRLNKLAERLNNIKGAETFIQNSRKAYQDLLATKSKYVVYARIFLKFVKKSHELLSSCVGKLGDTEKVVSVWGNCCNNLETLYQESIDLGTENADRNQFAKDHGLEKHPRGMFASAIPPLWMPEFEDYLKRKGVGALATQGAERACQCENWSFALGNSTSFLNDVAESALWWEAIGDEAFNRLKPSLEKMKLMSSIKSAKNGLREVCRKLVEELNSTVQWLRDEHTRLMMDKNVAEEVYWV